MLGSNLSKLNELVKISEISEEKGVKTKHCIVGMTEMFAHT